MRFPCWLGITASLFAAENAHSQDAALERRERARQFHSLSQQRTGVLVPMYVYPANIHTNAAYNRLIEIKRRYETVPFWVIVNPASGPGEAVEANYVKAIDRLQGAGCVTLGYVATGYGKRTAADVNRDVDSWLRMYPKTHGVFFDEMKNEDSEAGVQHQLELSRHARTRGCWPLVANPGTDVPERFFKAEAADVFVIHEGDHWPKEDKLKGDYFGGYSDYPPWTRGVLLHSQPKFDANALKTARKYCRWVYITEAPFRANDPKAANPWDRLSVHLEATCEALARE
jgi:hypothetical protein